ncbi:hypothetical protein AAF712_012007 [Marasmius tenuissimus]|uniref:Nucleoprotein n=1 Tax=Marasmius tenuissimus TaxID=585030 RepID=A0ABR2ZHQ6_9AGAR
MAADTLNAIANDIPYLTPTQSIPSNPPQTEWIIPHGWDVSNDAGCVWIRVSAVQITSYIQLTGGQAEGILVPVPILMLVRNSEPMKALFNLEGDLDTDSERAISYLRERVGMDGTRSEPIFWPSVRGCELEVFVGWLIEHADPTSFESGWGLLKVAHLLQTTAAYPAAIRSFKSLELTRWQKLAISAKWPIWHWLPSLITHFILDVPLTSIGFDGVLVMGSYTYYAIAKAKCSVMELRLRIASVVPALETPPSTTCSYPAHSDCRKYWYKLWMEDVGKRLLHPDNPLEFSSSAILLAVGKIEKEKYPQLNLNCRNAYMAKAVESGALDAPEKVVAASAKEAIMRHHQSSHMDLEDWERWDRA